MKRNNLKKVNKKIINNGSRVTRRKKVKKKSHKKLLIGIFIFLFIIVVIAASGYFYIKHKLNFMNYEAINEEEIAVNNDLFEELETDLTEDEFNGIINIALLGSDSRAIVSDPKYIAGRSDTIIIASLNPNDKSIKLISIPRDTYVSINGSMDKINHAYAYGKETLSLKTINSNFGLNIDQYITVNFTAVEKIVDLIGGVKVNITKADMEYINSRLKQVDIYETNLLYNYGNITLNGEQALIHARNRTTGGSDFDRADNQRQIINAMLTKVSTMSYNEILELSDKALRYVKTNITSDEYLGLFAKIFPDIKSYASNIESYQVPKADYSSGQKINGVYYYTTDLDKASEDFKNILYNDNTDNDVEIEIEE